MAHTPRSSLLIISTTCKALFGREVFSRLSGGRASLGELLHPIMLMLVILFVFNVIRMRSVGGIDTNLWIMVGILSFNMFRETATGAMNAASANRALFTYRQVKPVDTILIKAGLEAFLLLLVAIILFTGASFFDIDVLPADPLAVLEAFVGLWLLGLSYALTGSALKEVVPPLGKFLTMIMPAFYILSGVTFPLNRIPLPYRDWLLLNPLVHAVDAARLGFAPYYHAIPGLDVAYIYEFALVSLFLGLALQTQYSSRLMTK
jgi:capsular polysaccharide transport system permease protein